MATRVDLRTDRREMLVDITGEVARVAADSGITEGWVQVYCPHTTAAITINEHADPDVARDIVHGLGKLVPERADWRHSEGNADAHVKATIVGSGATVPVEEGRLVLGTWQGVFFCEFDGPRSRHALITVIGT